MKRSAFCLFFHKQFKNRLAVLTLDPDQYFEYGYALPDK
jgi:hypothetical protein